MRELSANGLREPAMNLPMPDAQTPVARAARGEMPETRTDAAKPRGSDPVKKLSDAAKRPAPPSRLPSLIVGLVVIAVVGLSIWYLVRPQPLLVQGEVDATRFDIAARVDGRVADIPVGRGQDVAAKAVLVKIDNPETIAKHEQALASISSPAPRPTHAKGAPARSEECYGDQHRHHRGPRRHLAPDAGGGRYQGVPMRVGVSYDPVKGCYFTTSPDVPPTAALSLAGVRKKVAGALMPDEPDIQLELDRPARLERARRRAQPPAR
jgi:hypothetical protein